MINPKNVSKSCVLDFMGFTTKYIAGVPGIVTQLTVQCTCNSQNECGDCCVVYNYFYKEPNGSWLQIGSNCNDVGSLECCSADINNDLFTNLVGAGTYLIDVTVYSGSCLVKGNSIYTNSAQVQVS